MELSKLLKQFSSINFSPKQFKNIAKYNSEKTIDL